MSASILTARARVAAIRLMVDACTIARETSGRATNLDTGQVVKVTTTVYTGQCRVQHGGVQTASMPQIGEAQLELQELSLQLPITVTDVRPDDLVTITSSVLDAGLTGRTFRVRGIGHKTHATARRLQLVEVIG